MRKIFKRLLVTAMALTIAMSGIVPGTEALEVQARPLISSQISTDDIWDMDGIIVLSPGASILFSQDGLLTIDKQPDEYTKDSIWTNTTSNEYAVTFFSNSSDFHNLTLESCSFSGNYYIDVWYDESFQYGTAETHRYRFELDSSTTMSKDSIIDTLYNYFPAGIVIIDDALYTNNSCSNSYGDTVDAENGVISLESGIYDVILHAFVLVGRDSINNSSSSCDTSTPKETTKEETKPAEAPPTPETHYGTFQEDAITKVQTVVANINKAAANGTTNQAKKVELNTGIWVSYNRAVYEEIQKCNVPVSITFIYQGTRYTVTIPANADVLSLVDENGYCGFLNLGAHYGYDSIEKLW